MNSSVHKKILFLSLLGTCSLAHAQNSIAIAMARCEYTPIPHAYSVVDDVYSGSNYAIKLTDISFNVYKNVQCTEYDKTDNLKGLNYAHLTAKYELPSKGDCLCLFDIDGIECECGVLAIVNNNGIVVDQIDASVASATMFTRQYEIDANYTISVYTFIPESNCESIPFETMELHRDMTIPGRIQKKDYIIENGHFVLTKSSVGDLMLMHCHDYIQNKPNLWDY